MPNIRDEQKLQQAISTALSQLRERAMSQMPDTGAFSPVSVYCACAALIHGVGEVELRIAPAGGEAGGKERYVDVRVRTPSKNSESSSWIFYGGTGALQKALQNEALLKDKVRTAILDAAESIARNEFK